MGEAAFQQLVKGYIELGWDAQFWEPEYLDAGEEVVVIWRMRARSAHGGGLPLETAFAFVLAVEAGKVRRIGQYLSRAEALEAAGLSE